MTQRFWQNVPMPVSSHIEDRRDDVNLLPDLASSSGAFPAQYDLYGLHRRQPLTPEQSQWLLMNMPKQLPASPMPDSQAMGMTLNSSPAWGRQ